MNKYYFILYILFLFISYTQGLSCSIEYLEDVFAVNDNIYIANIADKKNISSSIVEYTLQVQKNYKGNKEDGLYTARSTNTDNNYADFSLNKELEKGKTYVLFGDNLSTGQCGNNREYNHESDILVYLDILSKRHANPTYELYMKIIGAVSYRINYGLIHQPYSESNPYELLNSFKKSWLDKHSTCNDLIDNECNIRFDSCKNDFIDNKIICRDITQEEKNDILGSQNLCTTTGGRWNVLNCYCNEEYSGKLSQFHEEKNGRKNWDKDLGCISERTECEEGGNSRGDTSYTEEILNITDSYTCLEDVHMRFQNDPKYDYYKYYDFNNGYIQYWSISTNQCILRKYNEKYPRCLENK